MKGHGEESARWHVHVKDGKVVVSSGAQDRGQGGQGQEQQGEGLKALQPVLQQLLQELTGKGKGDA